MGLFSGSGTNEPAVAARLARIERKLDAIIAHLGLQLDSDGLDDIRAMAAAGDVIAAIKAYRERTGAGLAEAKRAVEQGL